MLLGISYKSNLGVDLSISIFYISKIFWEIPMEIDPKDVRPMREKPILDAFELVDFGAFTRETGFIVLHQMNSGNWVQIELLPGIVK